MKLASATRLALPRGFQFAAAAAGIKTPGRLDVGLAEALAGGTAAAVFTRNRVVATPVDVARRHLARSRGRVRAVLVNSGNANCATGTFGLQTCYEACADLAARLGCHRFAVVPASTGVIGVPLPRQRLLAALPELVRTRASSHASVIRFARTILTTDTHPKLATASLRVGRHRVRLLGIAKGAGMIQPRLATMLVFLFTDVRANAAALKRCLRTAARESFEHLSVDGDTSTNDTVLLLASGASGARLAGRTVRAFQGALTRVCQALARQIAADGEGAQKLITLRVEGARSDAVAERVARAVANSPLVKTALAGADPNWGRVLAAVGASGERIEPSRVQIWLGRQRVCWNGQARPFNERAAHRYLQGHSIEVRIHLGNGLGAVTFWTCDLTADYVRLNASYRS